MESIGILAQRLYGGGAERVAANLSIALSKYYRVYLIVFDGSKITFPYGGEVISLDLPAGDGVFHKLNTFCKRVRALKKIKIQYNLSCVMSHLYGPSLANVMSRSKASTISCIHIMLSASHNGRIDKLKYRFLSRMSDKITNVSKKSTRDLIENFGTDKNNTVCMYNFSDLRSISHKSSEGLLPEEVEQMGKFEKTIVTCGRLSSQKAQWHLVRLLPYIRRKIGNVGLLILGEGEKRGQLEELVQSYDLGDAVVFFGYRDNPHRIISKSSVFALSSHYEGMPMVILEALCCGLPVVSCDFDSGAREILAPDTDFMMKTNEIEFAKYGILTPECHGDASSQRELSREEILLAEALITMLTDETKRQQYISRAQECLSLFSAETITEQWVCLIEDSQKTK